MNILFYSSYFHPYISGLTQSPARVLSKLSAHHKMTVLTFPHKKKLKPQESWKNMNIIRIPYLFKISKGYISPQSLFYFFREIPKNDVIFLNLPNVEALPMTLIAKLYRKKIISLYNCEVNLGDSFMSRCISVLLNAAVFIQLALSNTIIAYPDYIFHLKIGKQFKHKILETLPIITNVQPEAATLKKYEKRKNKSVWIGFVGRIAREKGIEYLIEAIKIIQMSSQTPIGDLDSRFHGNNITLVFAGPPPTEVAGEKEYAIQMIKLLEQKKIPYKFFGKLTDNQLAAFYKNIDLLVLPSTNHTEAFGMVQAEAMLHGTPVVASNLWGVRLPISLTKMGILVNPENPEELALAIKKVLKEKSTFANKKFVENAVKIFDPKKIYSFYEKNFSL